MVTYKSFKECFIKENILVDCYLGLLDYYRFTRMFTLIQGWLKGILVDCLVHCSICPLFFTWICWCKADALVLTITLGRYLPTYADRNT